MCKKKVITAILGTVAAVVAMLFIPGVIQEINEKRQIKYFKDLGCEVFEVDGNGKERKI